ncbi:MAG: ATPase, T2SS/T4P/T4SS family [Candidatus Omnitrophota bacterium]
MSEKKWLDLEAAVLERLPGKINLMLSQDERAKIIFDAMDDLSNDLAKKLVTQDSEILNSPDAKRQFVRQFLSYGMIEELLCDSEVEDIIINSLNYIYIHHTRKGLLRTEKRFTSQKELDVFIKKLLVFSGRSAHKKIINLELPNMQGRVNICTSPLGSQVTITKSKVEPLSIIDLVEKGMMSYLLAGQLWLYVEGLSVRPANIIIAGGPGTGKTTLLNAMFSFVPSNERMVIIEDTLELNTALDDSCSRLESDDDISMEELVKNSLRMRPDRVVVGEVRGAEAKDLMTAVNIGKNCLGTIHASNAREAILRLQNEPMNVPEILVNLIDVFIITRKLQVGGKVMRMIEEVSETGGMEQRTVLLSQLWKYDFEHNQTREVSPSTIYRDRLSKATGLAPRQIIDEVKVRARILEILAQKDISSIKEISAFCRAYNLDNDNALSKLRLTKRDLLTQVSRR